MFTHSENKHTDIREMSKQSIFTKSQIAEETGRESKMIIISFPQLQKEYNYNMTAKNMNVLKDVQKIQLQSGLVSAGGSLVDFIAETQVQECEFSLLYMA